MKKQTEWLIYGAVVAAVVVFMIWYWRDDGGGIDGAAPVAEATVVDNRPSCTNRIVPKISSSTNVEPLCSEALQMNATAKACVESKGFFFLNNNARGVCQSGGVIIGSETAPSFPAAPCSLQSALSSYLASIYPAADWRAASDNYMYNFYSNLEIHFKPTGVLAPLPEIAGSGPANVNILKKKLSRYARVEVMPSETSVPSLAPVDDFRGTLYWMVTGTGWFAECGVTLFAYNTCHALSLLGASAEKILSVAGPQLRTAVKAAQSGDRGALVAACVQPLPSELDATACQFSPRYPGLVTASIDPLALYKTVASCWVKEAPLGCGISAPLRRVLVEMASIRGFDSIQILNEPDSPCRAFIIFCSEAVYHTTLLRRGCPDAGNRDLNPHSARLVYLDAYLAQHVSRVSEDDFAGESTVATDAAEWAYKTRCANVGGVLNVVDVLTTCRQIVAFGSPFLVFGSEIQNIDWKSLPSSNELEKLQSYFSVVYGSPAVWQSKSLTDLQTLWASLEFRWNLPVQPTTPVAAVRRPNSKFYQSQTLQGTLDQDPDRPGENLEFVEVVRFGTAVSKYDNEQLFAGTYYWPVRGSGLFLPIGKTLFAYNKIHAFRLLGCTDEEIVYGLRPNVIAFIQNESNVAWTEWTTQNPTAAKTTHFKNYCTWNTASSSSSCPILFDIGMTTVSLCVPVVKAFIDDFCTGAVERKYATGVAAMSFFDQDPFLDRMIAQVASQRGFDSCVFVKQVGFDVAQELLHCKDPVTSLMSLKKFTPFSSEFSSVNSTPLNSVNFYVDSKIPRVVSSCVVNRPHVPFVSPSPCTLPKTVVRPLGSGIAF
jgi:hypothetical protein